MAEITSEFLVIETALRNSSVDLESRGKGVRAAPEMTFVGPLNLKTSDRAQIDGEPSAPDVVYEGAPNWWMPNTECVESLMWASGFEKTEVVFEHLFEPGVSHYGRGMVIGRR